MSFLKPDSLSSERRLILLIVALSLFVRCITVVALHVEPVGDYLGYDQMARNLVAGRGLVDHFGNAAFLSGGYPLFFLAPLYALFDHSALAVQLGNAVLGTLSTYLVYLLLREAKAGAAARVIGPLLFALYIPAWIYCEYLAKENLMTPLILMLLYLSARLHQNLALGPALAAGAIIALLAITGSAALALLPITFFAMMSAQASIHTRLRIGAVLVLATLVVLAPWQYRNAQAVGSPVINTNGGFNLYLGNNPRADGLFVSVADTPMGKAWQALRAKGELHASTQLKMTAIEWISENPGAFAQLGIKKAGLLWLPPIHQGTGEQSTMETLSRRIWLAQYIFLCGFALYVLMSMRRRNRYVAGLGAALVLYTGVHMLFYVIFRYREPVMPIVIVLAAIGIENVMHRFISRRPQLRIPAAPVVP